MIIHSLGTSIYSFLRPMAAWDLMALITFAVITIRTPPRSRTAHRVDTLHKIVISQRIPDLRCHTGHDAHAQKHIVRVRQLDANLGQRWSNWSHTEWNYIHHATWTTTTRQRASNFVVIYNKLHNRPQAIQLTLQCCPDAVTWLWGFPSHRWWKQLKSGWVKWKSCSNTASGAVGVGALLGCPISVFFTQFVASHHEGMEIVQVTPLRRSLESFP